MSLMVGTTGRRVASAAILVLMGLILFSSITSTQAIAGKAKKPKVSLTIKTKNQAALLKAKKLVVKVRSSRKSKVRLSASKGGKGGLFKKKSLRFKKRGTRKISLSLTKAGRKKLGKCGTQKVKVVGKYRKGKKKARAKRSKALRKDSNRCIDPVDYVTVPLGDDPEHCDSLDSTVCLQPFPNDYYTKPDASTPTGKRLNLAATSTPVNTGAENPVNIDVTDMNRGDGFSPGNAIMLKVPGLDTPAAFQNSGLVPLSNLHAYGDPAQSVMVIDAETGERHPVWAELDSNPTTNDPTEAVPGSVNDNPSNTEPVNLIVRPDSNFEYGHRYIVAFRNLKNASNQAIESPLGFRAYRDDLPTQQAAVENRRPHMESVIDTLTSKAGVDRSSLYMAWDFTVASEKSETGRSLQIRNYAFGKLGDNTMGDRKIQGSSPNVVITGVCNQGDDESTCRSNWDLPVPSGDMLRYVEGKLTGIPCMLDQNGCKAGAKFKFKPDGSVDINPSYTMDIPFRCIIPTAVQPGGPNTAVTPGPAGIYGHGLLGDYKQAISAGPQNVAKTGGSVWCGANWDGFSSPDLLTILESLGDMSNFNKAVDRMQQGFVNFMMLQRAMIHPDGFAQKAAFQVNDGSEDVSVIDTSAGENTRGQYMGISQGGIMGGALMALSPDSDHGVLGVPGMNYSTLLQRSVDSDKYFKSPVIGLYSNYPDLAERPILLSLVQLLWDRGEANGYAASMTTDPLPDTPPHSVLLRAAFGDHQVTNYAAEAEARTVGASVYAPALNPGRHWDIDPFMDMNQQSSFPYNGGSMLVYYDSGPPSSPGATDGIERPPLENVPPRKEWGFGGDPHEHPRRSQDGYTCRRVPERRHDQELRRDHTGSKPGRRSLLRQRLDRPLKLSPSQSGMHVRFQEPEMLARLRFAFTSRSTDWYIFGK
ncbi:MAG: hypothetical protein IPK93_09915 [Solirubrobacterales bacterium]|nr:hypothetical protein [Solirubrobacterales bacterium]